MKNVTYSLKKKTKVSISLDAKKNQGLCLCCQSALTCVYNRNLERPILQCEEFDGIIPLSFETSPPIKNPSTHLQETPSLPDDALQQLSGLCMNCEERATCTYPKPEGGVWHCDEYR
jgi:hypothetical protein